MGTSIAMFFNKKMIYFIGFITFIILLIGAWEYFSYYSKLTKVQKYDGLKTISSIKVNQIEEWFVDEVSDAELISQNKLLVERIEKHLNRKNESTKKELLEILKQLSVEHSYIDIYVTDILGNIYLNIDQKYSVLSEETIHFIYKAAQQEKVVFSDLYLSKLDNRIRIDLAAPIFNNKHKVISVLLLRIDPNEYLYPLIQSWPSESKSSEALIVRQDGDSVLFLNQLKYLSLSPLKLKVALSDSTIPSSKAVLGYEGIWEGPDYRNIEVLADLRKVKSTPWYMIAKVDISEVFSELYYRQAVIVAFTLLLILLSGLGLTLIYQSRQKNIYEQLFRQGKKLSEKEEKLRKFNRGIEQNPVSIEITDKEGRVEYVNPKFTEITGYTYLEVKGKISRHLKPGILLDEEYTAMNESIFKGKVWRGEYKNTRKNGEVFWESVTIAPILDNNKITNFIIMKQEITEIKNLIQQLTIEKERAEKSERLKSEFLAQMSHEIRTPINTIMSFISLIKEEYTDSAQEGIQESFKMIELGSMRITRTIDSILNMSELQTGSYEPKYENIEICSQVIEPLYNEFRHLAMDKSLNMELAINEKPICYNADLYTITQLFVNIIDNAIKYTKKGNIFLETGNNDKVKYIKISDTGIGMSEEYLEQIFEPFSQEEQGYTRKFEGTGLGLSLVKKYCELNKVDIDIKSKKGVGSVFTIFFTTV